LPLYRGVLKMRTRFLLFGLILLIAGLWSSALAQTSSDSNTTDLQKKVQQLEQVVKSLQQKVSEVEEASGKQAQQPPAAQSANKETAKPKDPAPVITAGRSGFTISSADKVYRLKIGGQIQVDGKFYHGDSAYYGSKLIDSFDIRKARPIFEGSLGQYIDFRFVSDFGSGKAQVFDAYMDIKTTPYSLDCSCYREMETCLLLNVHWCPTSYRTAVKACRFLEAFRDAWLIKLQCSIAHLLA
jgi:hypothetical protein